MEKYVSPLLSEQIKPLDFKDQEQIMFVLGYFLPLFAGFKDQYKRKTFNSVKAFLMLIVSIFGSGTN